MKEKEEIIKEPKPRNWGRYLPLSGEDFKYLSLLHKFAINNTLLFRIEYSEVEDCWEVLMEGNSDGEYFFSGKRIKYLADACFYALKDAYKFYEQPNKKN